MPKIKINTCDYHYHEVGSGSETIVFSHGLLWDHQMFESQINHLKSRYRILAYDHKGQGKSELVDDGYDMETLYEDALELIRQLSDKPVHFIGLSMGGFVGLRLAARNPERIKSLALLNTSAQDEPNKFKYTLLSMIVQIAGVKSVSRRVMKIMFGKKFLSDPNRKGLRKAMKAKLDSLDKSIIKAVDGVIKRNGVEGELNRITCPTLIMTGTQDKATVPAKSEFMHHKIQGSKLVYIEGAGHTSCVEEAEQINTNLEIFFNEIR